MYVLLEFWQKNHGDPYYEPTKVVRDKGMEQVKGEATKISIFYCQPYLEN